MEWIASLVLLAGLAAIAVADLREMRVPDVLSLPLIAAGLLVSAFGGRLPEAALGAVLGYGVFVAIETGYRRLRGRDGLGRGDAKLLAAGGAWCGVLALPAIVLVAAASGLAAAVAVPGFRRGAAIPFAPFLCIAIAVCHLGPASGG